MTNEQRKKIIILRGQGYGYTAIGKELQLSADSIRSFCRRTALKKDDNEKTCCKQCGQRIKVHPKRKRRVFCSDVCRTRWWNSHLDRVSRKAIYSFNCACCGVDFTAYGNRHRKYCSHECYIADRYGKELCSND